MSLFRRKQQEAPSASEIIDLTAPIEASDPPGLVWGMPSGCPRCGDYGYLDHIDLINEVMSQHCPTCWHRWEISKTETETANL